MNNADHLKKFLQRVTTDVQLTTTHIGVCTALAVAWIDTGFSNPFRTSRKKLMNAARIKSTATYHKIIGDLASLNYLKYEPSYHPTKGSQVQIL